MNIKPQITVLLINIYALAAAADQTLSHCPAILQQNIMPPSLTEVSKFNAPKEKRLTLEQRQAALINILKDLENANIPVSSSALRQNSSTELKEIVKKHLGYEMVGTSLYFAIRNSFGKDAKAFSKALELAGVSGEAVPVPAKERKVKVQQTKPENIFAVEESAKVSPLSQLFENPGAYVRRQLGQPRAVTYNVEQLKLIFGIRDKIRKNGFDQLPENVRSEIVAGARERKKTEDLASLSYRDIIPDELMRAQIDSAGRARLTKEEAEILTVMSGKIFTENQEIVMAHFEKIAVKEFILLAEAYARKQGKYNLNSDANDILQDGLVGLLKAIRDFDAERGFLFSTVVHPYVKNEITKGRVLDSRIQALDVNQVSTVTKLKHVKNYLISLNSGRSVSIEAIVAEYNKRFPSATPMVPTTAKNYLERAQLANVASIDAIAVEGERDSFDIPHYNEPYSAKVEIQKIELITELLEFAQLNHVEKQVLLQRFGLPYDVNLQFDPKLEAEGKSRDEMSPHFKLSGERLRQLENIALNKIRDVIQKNPKRYQELREALH